MRIHVLRLCALLALVAASPVALSSRQTAPAPFAVTHGPYLQLPAGDAMTVVWHTNRPAVSRVEYGPTDTLGMTAVSSPNGLIDNDRTSHAVRLTGLKPGTAWHYRVVSREFVGYEKQHIVRFGETVTGETASFRTLDSGAADFTFAMVSDIHENATRLDALLARIDWAGVPFVAFNGDMVNDFMNLDQPFSGFVDASVARFARTKPFVYIRGNHDVRGRHARRLADYFPTRDGRAYYSFDHGPVHFVVLDSGEDKVDSHEYYNGLVAFEAYRREQARWLEEDLRGDAAWRARYRVVFSHIPPRGASGFAIEQVRENWEGIANRGRVDLWLSGHTHKYSRLDPSAGQNAYALLIGAPDTLTRVRVSAGSLDVTVSRENGDLIDTFSVRPR